MRETGERFVGLVSPLRVYRTYSRRFLSVLNGLSTETLPQNCAEQQFSVLEDSSASPLSDGFCQTLLRQLADLSDELMYYLVIQSL